MPIDVLIPYGRSSEVIVERHFGSGLIIAKTRYADGWVYGPMRVGAWSVIPGYDERSQAMLAPHLANGSLLQVVPTGLTQGVNGMAVVDVMIDGRSMTELALETGIGIPDKELSGVALRDEAYIIALRTARGGREGYWQEYSAERGALRLMDQRTDVATAPQLDSMLLLQQVSTVVVIVVFIALAVRESKYLREQTGRGRKIINLMFGLSKGSFRS